MIKKDYLKNLKENKLIDYIEKTLYLFRYDIFAVVIILVLIVLYFDELINPGQIVFSDIDFPYNTKNYLEEVVGLWNSKWNTTSMLNIPRLIVILPSYLLSLVFGGKGSLFLKGFIFQQIIVSSLSMYLFTKKLISVYMGKQFNLTKTLALIFGSILYSLNPYVIFRIQHIYLLVGYSIFPLIILYFFKIFDFKFQATSIKGYNRYSQNIFYENIRDAFILAVLVTVASGAIHYFFYSVITLGISFILLLIDYTLKHKELNRFGIKKIWIAMFKKLFIFLGFFIGLSFYWLSIYIGSILTNVQVSQHNINVIDTFTMFSRNSDIGSVLLLNSYWWRMMPSDSFNIYFYISGIVLLIVILIGVFFNVFKKNIITLTTILGVLMIIIATGVKYPFMSNLFLFLCDLPFFGNVFRDPNKMVGLLALSYSVLLVFGMESLVSIINYKKNRKILTSLLFTVVSISMVFYLLPMKNNYEAKYLKPVVEPQGYKELREYYSDASDYGIYLPIAEQMLRPFLNISTPKWNTSDNELSSKATGDVHIYNSPIKTLFHHEGNDPIITYYLNWVQNLLDKGRSVNLDNYIKAFGANQFIYHDEYIEQEFRQDFNKEILSLQKKIKLKYENDIFSVYDISINENDIVNKKLWTPYGLYKFEGYNQLVNYDPITMPVIFLNKEEVEFNKSVVKDDYLEFDNLDEIIFAVIDNKYRLYPFDWVEELNPFLKWSKTYLSNSDWSWYMEQLENAHRAFDFDKEAGVAVTFSSGKFNILPHEKDKITGELVMDFDTMLRTDTFFIPDTPTIFDIKANPMDDFDSIGAIYGVISRGDPNDIWQVAKSSLIRAYENTPYGYNILVSGRHVNKLHVKVRFFDENRDEIGVQYVVAPNEVINFEVINFFGETVSPKNTKYMRIDLLSFQRPESKTYWWIHDINIYDYSKYKTKNIITGTMNPEKSDEYELYIRSFKSEDSGVVNITIEDGNVNSEFIVNNYDESIGFKWTKFGEMYLENKEYNIHIENISKFNAINQILYIPKSKKEEMYKPIVEAINSSTQIITLEGEKDFYTDANIQSKRFIPELSYGAFFSISNGKIEKEIEIAESNYYNLNLGMYFPNENKGIATIKIYDKDNILLLNKIILPIDEIEVKNVVNYIPLSLKYRYELINRENIKYFKSLNDFENIYLEKGIYKIEIIIDSKAENLVDIYQLRKFDGSEIIVSKFAEDPYFLECSPCESITMDMFDREIIDSTITIKYDATCSCDWYIYSSEKIDVNVSEELRVEFDAKSELIEKRHPKLVFLDEYDHIVDITFIYEVEEQLKSEWNSYEQLVIVPEGAVKVMLQFWARGNKEKEGYLKIKNLKLERYDEYISVDYLNIIEKNNQKLVSDKAIVKDINSMKKTISIKEELKGLTWNSFLSPTKLWKTNDKSYDYSLNGITMGYILENSETELSVKLMNVYKFGLVLHVFTVLIGIIIIRERKKH